MYVTDANGGTEPMQTIKCTRAAGEVLMGLYLDWHGPEDEEGERDEWAFKVISSVSYPHGSDIGTASISPTFVRWLNGGMGDREFTLSYEYMPPIHIPCPSDDDEEWLEDEE